MKSVSFVQTLSKTERRYHKPWIPAFVVLFHFLDCVFLSPCRHISVFWVTKHEIERLASWTLLAPLSSSISHSENHILTCDHVCHRVPHVSDAARIASVTLQVARAIPRTYHRFRFGFSTSSEISGSALIFSTSTVARYDAKPVAIAFLSCSFKIVARAFDFRPV